MDSHSGKLDVPNEAFSLLTPEVVKALRTDLHTGLSSTEALDRRKQFGANVGRQSKRPAAWRRFLVQFHDPQIYLLLAAAAVTSIVKVLEHAAGTSYETSIILAIVLMNAVLSFLQEDRAERALAALADLMPRQATVLRDSVHQQLLAESLVPGDVILLNEGDMIPADARLTEVRAFVTNEAPLTGESLPVSKQVAPLPSQTPLADQSNMIFTGTIATAGTAAAVVTAIGERTEFGKISSLLTTTKDPDTPLQRQLKTLSKQLGVAVIFIAAATSVALLIAGGSHRPDTILTVLLFAIALAVAAAPEGLAAITTLVLAIGVQRMARQGAIVKKLSAVETLGSTTVIASDKTGTMTKNEITVRSLVTASAHVDLSGAGYSTFGSLTFQGTASPTDGQREEIQDLLVAATLANNAHITAGSDSWRIQGDPTEAALLIAAQKGHLSTDELRSRHPRVTEIPFSSERKRMTTVHLRPESPDHAFSITKGAPDILLDLCTTIRVGTQSVPFTSEQRAVILNENAELARAAMRVLAIASRPVSLTRGTPSQVAEESAVESGLTLLGLIGMIDPPRPEAKTAVEKARRAGVRTILVTGDQPLTATAVARELGIASDGICLTGTQLDVLSDGELARKVEDTQVFARVRPEHKLRIVQALQQNNEIVAMTGDGVNDAPALKAAHIGVAMGIAGTDVSKEAADLVLTDDNFAAIVSAIEQGRVIFDNIQKVLRYLLATNLGEILTLFVSALLLSSANGSSHALVLPLTAAQILWINLITDSGPALALGVDPPSPDVLGRPPRTAGTNIVDSRMLLTLLPTALTMTVASLAIFFLLEAHQPLAHKRTLTFTALILCQLFNSLSARSTTRSAFQTLFNNRRLWFAIVLSICAQLIVTEIPYLQRAFDLVPLDGSAWLRCTVMASSVLAVNELTVLYARGLSRTRGLAAIHEA